MSVSGEVWSFAGGLLEVAPKDTCAVALRELGFSLSRGGRLEGLGGRGVVLEGFGTPGVGVEGVGVDVASQFGRIAHRVWEWGVVEGGEVVDLRSAVRLEGTAGAMAQVGAHCGSFSLLADTAAALLVGAGGRGKKLHPNEARVLYDAVRRAKKALYARAPEASRREQGEEAEGAETGAGEGDRAYAACAQALLGVLALASRQLRARQRENGAQDSNPPPPASPGPSSTTPTAQWEGGGGLFVPDGSPEAVAATARVMQAIRLAMARSLSVGPDVLRPPEEGGVEEAVSGVVGTVGAVDAPLAVAASSALEQFTTCAIGALQASPKSPKFAAPLAALAQETAACRFAAAVAARSACGEEDGAAEGGERSSRGGSRGDGIGEGGGDGARKVGGGEERGGEVGLAASRAERASARAALIITATSGVAMRALDFVKVLRRAVKSVAPGHPVPAAVGELVSLLPDALAACGERERSPALTAASNLLAFVVYRGLLLDGGENFGPDPDAEGASEGGHWLRSVGVELGDGEESAASEQPPLSSKELRSLGLEVWRAVLTRADVVGSVDVACAQYSVSQLLFHLHTMLRQFKNYLDRASRGLVPPMHASTRAGVVDLAAEALEKLRHVVLDSPVGISRDSAAASAQLEYTLTASLGYRDPGADPAQSARAERGQWDDASAAVARLHCAALELLRDTVFHAFKGWTENDAVPPVRRGALVRSHRVAYELQRLKSNRGSLRFSRRLHTLYAGGAAPVHELRATEDARIADLNKILLAAAGGYGAPLDEIILGVPRAKLVADSPPLQPSGGSEDPLEQQLGAGRSAGADFTLRPMLGIHPPEHFLSMAVCGAKVVSRVKGKRRAWAIVRPNIRRAMVPPYHYLEMMDQRSFAALRAAANNATGPLVPCPHNDPTFSPLAPLADAILPLPEVDAGRIGSSDVPFGAERWGEAEGVRTVLQGPQIGSPAMWAVRQRLILPGPGLPKGVGRLLAAAEAAMRDEPTRSERPRRIGIPPLAAPIDFALLGAVENSEPRAFVWQPLPPTGYRALGVVVTVLGDVDGDDGRSGSGSGAGAGAGVGGGGGGGMGASTGPHTVPRMGTPAREGRSSVPRPSRASVWCVHKSLCVGGVAPPRDAVDTPDAFSWTPQQDVKLEFVPGASATAFGTPLSRFGHVARVEAGATDDSVVAVLGSGISRSFVFASASGGRGDGGGGGGGGAADQWRPFGPGRLLVGGDLVRPFQPAPPGVATTLKAITRDALLAALGGTEMLPRGQGRSTSVALAAALLRRFWVGPEDHTVLRAALPGALPRMRGVAIIQPTTPDFAIIALCLPGLADVRNPEDLYTHIVARPLDFELQRRFAERIRASMPFDAGNVRLAPSAGTLPSTSHMIRALVVAATRLRGDRGVRQAAGEACSRIILRERAAGTHIPADLDAWARAVLLDGQRRDPDQTHCPARHSLLGEVDLTLDTCCTIA